MSVNILEMVKGAVSDQVMGQIGGLLGQNDVKKTSSMFETATQSILGGLMKKASTQQGSQDVFRAVQNHDDGVLDKLGDLLGGGGREADLMKSGGGIMDMVFGKSQSGMLGTIGKFLGLNDSMMGKLMQMAAPIVMGVIGRHVKNKALDAVGLGSLLGNQKSFLSSSMPSGLTSSLGFSDMFGGAADAVKGAGSAVAGAGSAAAGAVGNAGSAVAGAAGNAGRAVTGAAGNAAGAVTGAAGDAGRAVSGAAGDAVGAGGSILKFLFPLVLLAALCYLAWTFIAGGGVDKVGDMAGDAAGAVAGAADGVTDAAGGVVGGVTGAAGDMAGKMKDAAGNVMNIGDVDWGGFDMQGLSGQFDGITDGFQNVTAENAGGLASKIQGLTGSIDGMGLGNLTGTAQTASQGFIGQFIQKITDSLGGITDGGILATLKPAVDALIEKLTPFK